MMGVIKKQEEQLDLPIGQVGWIEDEPITPFSEIQAKRKEEGRCPHCGEVLQMRWTGLDECQVCTNEQA